jgi:hypothetical protein
MVLGDDEMCQRARATLRELPAILLDLLVCLLPTHSIPTALSESAHPLETSASVSRACAAIVDNLRYCLLCISRVPSLTEAPPFQQTELNNSETEEDTLLLVLACLRYTTKVRAACCLLLAMSPVSTMDSGSVGGGWGGGGFM